MNERVPTNVMVEVIDSDALCALVHPHLKDLPQEARLRLDQTYGIVRTKNGTYLLDDDGVGEESSIEQEAATVHITRKDVMLAFSPWTIKITKDHLPSLPIKEKVELSKFIRVFGKRLEANFRSWVKFLEKQESVQ